MSTPKGIKQVIWSKTSNLADNIIFLSNNLTGPDYFGLKNRLQQSASKLPEDINQIFTKEEKRIDNLKKFINVSTTLEDCKEYLLLIESLKYGQVTSLVNQVNEIIQILKVNSKLYI